MKLTIITITRDNHEELKKSIRSYKSYLRRPEIEVIIIDGSTKEIFNRNKDFLKNFKTIKIIHNKPSGISNALNSGIENAKGKWIIFVNAGDELIHQHIEKLTENNTNYLIYGVSEIFNQEKNKLIHYQGKPIRFWPPIRMPFNHQSVIYRRDLFLEIGLFDTRFKLAMDYDHLLRTDRKLIEFKKVAIGRFYLGGVSSNAKEVFKEWRDAQIKNGFNVFKSCIILYYFLFRFYLKKLIQS